MTVRMIMETVGMKDNTKAKVMIEMKRMTARMIVMMMGRRRG